VQLVEMVVAGVDIKLVETLPWDLSFKAHYHIQLLSPSHSFLFKIEKLAL